MSSSGMRQPDPPQPDPPQPDPWQGPASEPRRPSEARGSQRGVWPVTIGVAWQMALLVGIVDFVFEVRRVFQTLQEAGSNEPELMAAGIWTALLPVYLWGLAGTPGLLITAVAMLRSSYRPRWLFWTSVGFALLYLPIVPLGTGAAILLLVTVLAKRSEFFPATRAASAAPRA